MQALLLGNETNLARRGAKLINLIFREKIYHFTVYRFTGFTGFFKPFYRFTGKNIFTALPFC